MLNQYKYDNKDIRILLYIKFVPKSVRTTWDIPENASKPKRQTNRSRRYLIINEKRDREVGRQRSAAGSKSTCGQFRIRVREVEWRNEEATPDWIRSHVTWWLSRYRR